MVAKIAAIALTVPKTWLRQAAESVFFLVRDRKRPMPYRETPPFSLTFKVRPPLSLLLSWGILNPQALQLLSSPIQPAHDSFCELPSRALFDRNISI
jgi:hypothetical protein